MPTLPAPPAPEPGHVLLATCVIDRSGRIGAAPLLAAMDWHAGDPVQVDLTHGAVIIQALREGRLRIGSRGDISIPSSVRAMSGLQPGQDVLLAALTGHGLLVVHRADAVARLLGRVHRRILGDLR
jgi:bifunctional DNA-binding transcriptional regulator/antitoxin component of YhaV-PrlF toxin-antitoxin module